MSTPMAWVYPWDTGCFTWAMEDRLVMVPIPASLDQTPLCMPVMMTAPSPPPRTDGMLKAYSKMETIPLITPSGPRAMQMMQTTNQAMAMRGTTLTERSAILYTPPMRSRAVAAVRRMANTMLIPSKSKA